MFSFFPSTPRRRMVAVLVAFSAALSMASVSAVPANELDDRKRRVQKQVREARKDFGHSTKALVRATRAVEAAEAELSAAERILAQREGELSAAVALDNEMQARLEAATERLKRARVALRKGRRDLGEQERVLATIAAQTYQAGDPELAGLTMVLSSRDPSELSSQLNSVRNVLDKESATLHRLEAARVLLTLQEERVAEARAEVAEQRRAAAESLERKRELEASARAAAEEVAALVEARSAAQAKASRAKADDERRLRQLEKERDQISRMLKKQARIEARKRAAAAKKAAAAKRSQAPTRSGPRKRTGLSHPVNSYITSSYGMRLHPIYKRWRLHDGTDFGASCGTPIRAAAPGRVIGKYYNTGYGKRVIIAHGYMRGASISTTYNHLRGYSTYVGQRVRRGEIIGFAGTTGYSTGCHLHFMVFRNGRTVDPMNWL